MIEASPTVTVVLPDSADGSHAGTFHAGSQHHRHENARREGKADNGVLQQMPVSLAVQLGRARASIIPAVAHTLWW